MHIRPYQSDDFESLHRIDQACFPRGVAYSLWELRHYIESNRSMTLVAEDEAGHIAGFIIAQMRRVRNRGGTPARPACCGHIITIDLLPEYRRSGIGTQLLRTVEEALLQQGADTIFLETATDNAPALAFYRAHGYTVLDTMKGYYANGSAAYLMAKTRPKSKG
jgi:ribosomal-protein-alanine N-acetyltransferase